MATLELPEWLELQLSSLHFKQLGLHTDFVRLNRVLARMQAEHASGALIVLGPQPAALVLSEGAPTVIYPTGREGEHADMVAARAVGWVCILSGQVAVGAEAEARAESDSQPVFFESVSRQESDHGAPEPPSVTPAGEISDVEVRAEQVHLVSVPEQDLTADPEPEPPVEVAPAAAQAAPPAPPPASLEPKAEPKPESLPVPAQEPAATTSSPSPPVSPTGVHAGERFVAASGARELPEDLAAKVQAIVGLRGQPLIALLDGTRTIQEIADLVGVSADDVDQVVKVLVGARLAFRYVSRSRTGARSSG
jgi:hypothetical protein